MINDPAIQAADQPACAELAQTSLIIPSRNRPGLLLDTVRSILEGAEVPTEIIIVDQSDVQHQALAQLNTDRACHLRYLWRPTPGVSRARNIGIAAAQYDLLAFIDDDMFVSPTWFGALVRALVDGGSKSIVTGRVLPAEERSDGFVPSTTVGETHAVYEGYVSQDVLYSGNMAIYRSIIDRVGVFDERLGPGTRFPAAEDNDLGFRLLQAGYRILFVPEALLYHRAWRSERDYLPLRWAYGVGRGAFYAKHINLRDRYMLRRMIRDVSDHVIRSLRRLRGERQQAYGDLILALGILSSALRWTVAQRRPRR